MHISEFWIRVTNGDHQQNFNGKSVSYCSLLWPFQHARVGTPNVRARCKKWFNWTSGRVFLGIWFRLHPICTANNDTNIAVDLIPEHHPDCTVPTRWLATRRAFSPSVALPVRFRNSEDRQLQPTWSMKSTQCSTKPSKTTKIAICDVVRFAFKIKARCFVYTQWFPWWSGHCVTFHWIQVDGSLRIHQWAHTFATNCDLKKATISISTNFAFTMFSPNSHSNKCNIRRSYNLCYVSNVAEAGLIVRDAAKDLTAWTFNVRRHSFCCHGSIITRLLHVQ